MSIFEGVCPDCGGEITDVVVECHPNQVQNWTDDDDDSNGVQVKTNENMAPSFSMACTSDISWIESRLTIYTCRCSSCVQQFYLEQNLFGDWS